MDSETRSQSRGAELHLYVPPDPRLGVYVRREVLAFAETNGVSTGELIDFVSAVGEALANAIEHARTEEPIEILAWLLDDGRLFTSIQDTGIGFIPSERTLSARLPDSFAERGRGLPIMRECADMFSLHSVPGQGTRVTLGCYVNRASEGRRERSKVAG